MDVDAASLTAKSLIIIGTRLNLVHSLLLGFLTCSLFSSLTFDYCLIWSLVKHRFNLFVFLNRLTYLFVKYIGRSYFIIAVLLGQIPHQLDCTATTRIHQVVFYLTLVANHWLFCLRTLATWRGNKSYPYILSYSIIGILCLITAATVNFWDGKGGSVIEPFGCVYLLNRHTLPRLGVSVSLVTIGMIYHTINMTLAAMRLSSFSETLGEVEEKIPSWTSFAGNFSSNVSAMIRGGGTIASKSHSGAALAEVLIRQGFHQWFMRLLCLIFFIFIPLFAFKDNPTLVMAGISLYTAADIELGCHIFRATSNAMRTPLPEQTTSTFFSSRPIGGIPMSRGPLSPTSPVTSRHRESPVTSRDRILTIEKPLSPSRAHFQDEDRATTPFPCSCFSGNAIDSHV